MFQATPRSLLAAGQHKKNTASVAAGYLSGKND